jgi:S1-C subfamily serine protease
MKHSYIFLTLISIILASCETDIDWFGGDFGSPHGHGDKKNDDSVIIVNNVPEILLESSVTVISKNSRNKTLAQGSGAFIANNKIVTNFHVIEGGVKYEIILNSNNSLTHEATVLKINRVWDIAILEIDVSYPANVLKINTNYPAIGDDIIVAGSPFGLEGTISKGNISAIRQFPPDDYDLFQISAPISPGSSGGPVVNLKGDLIGISVSGIKADGAQNLNFAIPAKYISFLLQ